MIFGIGTDIVRVARMEKNLERFGDRFARRLLTENELRDYAVNSSPAHFLAKRFAAKEAAAKAMGIGFREGLSLRQIGVGHDGKGKPQLEFNGYAAAFIEEHGINAVHVSLADEADHAVAFVTLGAEPAGVND
ncbi:MAG: holo-ACP synthase [Acidiferrobacterales bacterium]|jgi:holo-[acyl-carrier protein] synthase|nr:holo-ACP synthase [Acidiferrobacterales bacterium]